MKTYIYKVENHSDKRGYNKFIVVYRVKHNKPEFIGDMHVNTASYAGDRPTANKIIAENTGCKIERDIYSYKQNFNLYEV